MPGGDRTGPMGYGPMTGRGLGFCSGVNMPGYGAGFGRLGLARRRGFGRGFGYGFGRGIGYGFGGGYPVGPVSPEAEKELLQNEKNVLQQQLAAIEKQLEDL